MELFCIRIDFLGLRIGKKSWIVGYETAVYKGLHSLFLAIIEVCGLEVGRGGTGGPTRFPKQVAMAVTAGKRKWTAVCHIIGHQHEGNDSITERQVSKSLFEIALKRFAVIFVCENLGEYST